MHRNECHFYEDFGSSNIVPIAKIYGIEEMVPNQQDGAIIMEYLKADGANQPRGKSYNEAQVGDTIF